MMDYCVIYSTAGSVDEADRIALALVEQKLAACVQKLSIGSVYRWKNQIETADEVLMLIKTRKELSSLVIGWLKSNHSYDVPEAVSVDIADGLDTYLEWIRENTLDSGSKE